MTLSESLVIFAKQNADADAAMCAILGSLSDDDREKERGSYYKSLSGLARHILGGTIFLSGIIGPAISADNAAAKKAFDALCAAARPPEGKLDEKGWKDFCAALRAADEQYTALVAALGEKELNANVDSSLFKWGVNCVPAAFMLQQIVTHNLHHRGQISQILDEMKIDNNYSGISAALL